MPSEKYSFFADQPSDNGTYKAFWREGDLSEKGMATSAIAIIELISPDGGVLEVWELKNKNERKFSEKTKYKQIS